MRLPGWLTCTMAIAGLLPALTVLAQTNEPAAPVEAAIAPHPLVADLTSILAVLGAKHIQVDPAAAQGALYACVARMADEQARLLTDAEYTHLREEHRGVDYQLGVRITMTNATPCITGVDTNSPAQAAGLGEGDLITAIGDRAATNLTIAEACRLLRSHTNDTVRLVVQKGSGSIVTANVSRVLSPVESIETAEKMPQSIGYLKVNGLYKDAGHDLVSILRGWAETGRFGFVLDLRGAGGDDLASVVPVGSLFATGGSMLFALRDLEDQDLSVYKASEGDPLTMPVMVLIDGNTSGAAEVLAAVLADSVRGALLVGAPTRGDALVREGLPLPDGELLYITTRKLATANGAIYGGAARVEPDLKVAEGATSNGDFEPEAGPDRRATLEVEAGDRALRDRIRGDAALKRAIDVLLGLKALNIRANGLPSP